VEPIVEAIVEAIMDRRAFVGQCSIAALGLGGIGAAPRRLPRIGLELYSVRDAMRRDPERTMAAVRAMGYTDVELLWSFGNFGRTPVQVRQTLDATGLRAPSAHIAPSALEQEWERALEMAHVIGHESLIVPSLPAESSRTLDEWKRWAERFNRAGEQARRAGLWLAMHNEPGHQRLIDGRVPFDLFVASTDPAVVRLQLDVGNLVMGGGDPLDFLARFGERCWSFHLKDVVADRTRDTDLGRGIVPLARILAAIPEIERKPCFVEQEGARDPLASAKADYDHLSRLEF
jgi:sugar phosphate isomerase/epimerase